MKDNHKSRIKKRKLNFTQIANSFLRDKRLSFKAKGLFTYMFSHDESWNFTLNSISKQQEEGVDSIRSAMNELKAYGYVVYKKYSNGTGIYYLDDEPHLKDKETIDNLVQSTLFEKEDGEKQMKEKINKTPRYLEKDLKNSKNKENIKNQDLHPQNIIEAYSELISPKYEDITQTRSFNQITLYGEDLEKMLKGIKNYSKALKLKQKKPEKLFFFVKDKIYLDYQNEQAVELNKNEAIVPEDLIGLKFKVDGEEIEFLEDGYYKTQKDWKVTNVKMYLIWSN